MARCCVGRRVFLFIQPRAQHLGRLVKWLGRLWLIACLTSWEDIFCPKIRNRNPERQSNATKSSAYTSPRFCKLFSNFFTLFRKRNNIDCHFGPNFRHIFVDQPPNSGLAGWQWHTHRKTIDCFGVQVVDERWWLAFILNELSNVDWDWKWNCGRNWINKLTMANGFRVRPVVDEETIKLFQSITQNECPNVAECHTRH